MTSLAGVAALRGAGIAAPILGGDGLDIGAAWQQVPQADKIYFTTHAYLGADNPGPARAGVPRCLRKGLSGQAAGRLRGARLRHRPAADGGDQVRRQHASRQAVRKALAATHDFAGVTGTISYRGGSRIPAKSVSIIAVTQGRQSLAASVLPEKIPAP